jgi:hypothetical protein
MHELNKIERQMHIIQWMLVAQFVVLLATLVMLQG